MLLERDEVAGEAVVFWGACDSLSTPRPLGPLWDVASQSGGELADLLATGGSRDRVFSAALRLLSAPETVGDGVMFRHELARLAVRDAIAPVRARELHRRALAALAEPPHGTVEEARVAHHAIEAGDADAVLAHAPVAAELAARVGGHREAAGHLDQAVRTSSTSGFGRRTRVACSRTGTPASIVRRRNVRRDACELMTLDRSGWRVDTRNCKLGCQKEARSVHSGD